MTTKSPAETFGQQAEAVAGKRMSWTDTAARMLLGPAIASVVGYSIGTGIQRRQEAQQAARDAQRAADRSAALAAQREAHRRQGEQLDRDRRRRDAEMRDLRRAERISAALPDNPAQRINVGLLARASTPSRSSTPGALERSGRPRQITHWHKGARSNWPHGDL